MHRGADITALLSLDDVDGLITSTALRAPAFRVVKDGVTLPASACTRRARVGSRTITDLIDPGRVLDHFAEGATIVLQGLHRYWDPVTALCRDLEVELTHPLQANAYITPPVAQGLRVHADAHDVFALQTHGHKQWVVYDGQAPDPDGDGADPTMDVTLDPGDCLYLPKGVHHAARTVDHPSIHLTLGVRTTTWADVIRPLLDRAAADPALSEALPAGFAHEPASVADEAARRLQEVVKTLADEDAGQAVVDAAQRFWSRRAPDLRGQLAQTLGLAEIDDRTRVRSRPDRSCAVTRHGDRIHLDLGDRILRMPARVEPAVRAVLRLGQLTPADLADHLDEVGRIVLVRRLVREGLLMARDD